MNKKQLSERDICTKFITPSLYLRNVNVRWFDFDLSDVFEMRFEDSELDEFALRRGDVLICEGGEPGRAAVWDQRG
jgi:type I restriction enzyme S subunit